MARTAPDPTSPTPVQIRRWRRYLADELAEAATYRDLAGRRSGEVAPPPADLHGGRGGGVRSGSR
ncbi:hypothetical protein NB037_18275, partial [Rathayibacter sp. ZW T2_19]|nr:hypothetical protein [Rathayibacter rubneri]